MSPQALQSERTVSSFAQHYPLAARPIHLLVSDFGGVDSLINELKENGLTEDVDGWLNGTRKAKPLSTEQVNRFFGVTRLQQLSEWTGESIHETENLLAKYVPRLIQAYGSDLAENGAE